jgi:hypothetical protein
MYYSSEEEGSGPIYHIQVMCPKTNVKEYHFTILYSSYSFDEVPSLFYNFLTPSLEIRKGLLNLKKPRFKL